jgi:hypothetical protein
MMLSRGHPFVDGTQHHITAIILIAMVLREALEDMKMIRCNINKQ